jgi:endonuclease/exonuclease/phosphatase family metal-dependent hydrolase
VQRLIALVLAVAGAAGGWFFLQNFKFDGLDEISLRPRATSSGGETTISVPLAPGSDSDLVRIASFNIQVFGESKASKPHVMQVLAEIVRRFDVVAIQEIRAKNQQLLPEFVELVNSTGRHYDFEIGPRLGRTDSKEQYAFIFDAARIEIGRLEVYTVSDPDDLLHRPPLVAPFRVRGPPPEQAFTFTLINIHTDPDETDIELDALADVYLSVRNDGRGEDDIILLGDLNVDDQHLGRLGTISEIHAAIAGVPTNTLRKKQYDNIILHRRSTVEYVGRAGVFDIMREFNLTMEQAQDVSDHLPIWAEFTPREHGVAGPIAALPEPATSR